MFKKFDEDAKDAKNKDQDAKDNIAPHFVAPGDYSSSSSSDTDHEAQ